MRKGPVRSGTGFGRGTWRRFQASARGIQAVFLMVILAVAPPAAVSARDASQKRIALVIGVGNYQTVPPLENTVNDARSIGDALRRLDFEVTELFDPDFRQLSRGIRDFGVRAQTADAAVVYYAGHGIQSDHENYLVPVDAKLEQEHDLLFEALPLRFVLGEVAQAQKIGIILLDACRNNPFVSRLGHPAANMQRAVSTKAGLARVEDVPRNTMVVMATKSDQTADDGSSGHSPFADALLAHFQIPGLELGLFFRSVRDAVLRATGNRQEPFVFSSLGAEPFYFHPRAVNRPPAIGPASPLQVGDRSGPTLLGFPRPTDPDGDALSIRITGLPRAGEVRVNDRIAELNDIFPVEAFMAATYKPDGRTIGAVGAVTILVDDGRGGSVTGSLPITVASSNRAPLVEPKRTARFFVQRLGIPPPSDPDGDTLTITVTALPRGLVRNGAAAVYAGQRLQPGDLPRLTFVPDADVTGPAGSFQYIVEDGRGGRTEGQIDVEVSEAPPATARAEPPAKPVGTPPADQLAGLKPPVPQHDPAQAAKPPMAVPGLMTMPKGKADTKSFQDCPTCPPMLMIPGGSFIMGQDSRDPSAVPAHPVTIRPFAIGMYPVTVGEWKQCLSDGGCSAIPRVMDADDRTPIYNVSWDDAHGFLDWLSRKAGKPYRLPSEAEWEYAARARTTTRYWWGDQISVAMANCAECGGEQDSHRPLPVDSFRANPFGLYAVAGGVAQWTADCWFSSYRGAPSDGSARDAPECTKRVLRAGSFRSPAENVTATSRDSYDAQVRYIANGFRVARDPG
ncbi:MAG: SUMF1/EgtB/PvdO family nonheme iron enzyme [Rhodopila sp.]